jgi:hypothetical protein
VIHAEPSERRILMEVIERDTRMAMRMLRAFPRERADVPPLDCPHTARELAWRFVAWERLVHYLLIGRSAASGTPPATMTEIIPAFESAHAETRLALLRMSHERWVEIIHGPVTNEVWERGRRGDLLWMAWKALVHHGEHFAAHLRLAREEDAFARERARTAGTAVPAVPDSLLARGAA